MNQVSGALTWGWEAALGVLRAEDDFWALLRRPHSKAREVGAQKLKPQEPGPDCYCQLLITTVTSTKKPTQASL